MGIGRKKLRLGPAAAHFKVTRSRLMRQRGEQRRAGGGELFVWGNVRSSSVLLPTGVLCPWEWNRGPFPWRGAVS